MGAGACRLVVVVVEVIYVADDNTGSDALPSRAEPGRVAPAPGTEGRPNAAVARPRCLTLVAAVAAVAVEAPVVDLSNTGNTQLADDDALLLLPLKLPLAPLPLWRLPLTSDRASCSVDPRLLLLLMVLESRVLLTPVKRLVSITLPPLRDVACGAAVLLAEGSLLTLTTELERLLSVEPMPV